MQDPAAVLPSATLQASDEDAIARVLGGESALFEVLMRRYNQRVFRVARAILRDPAEAEDVVQETWVRAYQHLRQFQGRSSFATWLLRIAHNEALARIRRHRRTEELDAMEEYRRPAAPPVAAGHPEQHAHSSELSALLEQAIDKLPGTYRLVFVLREVEELSTEETARSLDISEENVKVRLHRARAMLRRELYARTGAQAASAFQFGFARCDLVVQKVFARIREMPAP